MKEMANNVSNVRNGTTTESPSDEPCASSDIYVWYNCVINEHVPASVIVDRFVTPIWYVIGILGNLLILNVWIRRRRRGSVVTSYLTILAVSDLLLLFLHIVIELKFAWNIKTIDAEGWCQTVFVLFMLMQYMSPMLIVGFTLERFISIAMPFRSERFSKRSRAPLEISVITTLAIVFSIPQIFGWTYQDGVCQGSQSPFFAYWSWFSDILIFCILPTTSFVLNIFVVVFAKRSMKEREITAPMCKSNPTHSTWSKSKIRISTVTLLCVSFYRIFTVLPVAICYALQFEIQMGNLNVPVLQMKDDVIWKRYFDYITAKKIIDEIGLTQYTCNVFIYFATIKHFRNDVRRVFRMCVKPSYSDSFEMSSLGTNTTNYQKSTTISKTATYRFPT